MTNRTEGTIRGFSIIAAVIIVITLYFWPRSEQQTKTTAKESTTKQQYTKSYRTGDITQNIGHQDINFGSMNQATNLLELINEIPNKANYQILYTTGSDSVVFGCDFNRKLIVRIHHQQNGHGSQEAWAGFIIDRLKSASNGGHSMTHQTEKYQAAFRIFNENNHYFGNWRIVRANSLCKTSISRKILPRNMVCST